VIRWVSHNPVLVRLFLIGYRHVGAMTAQVWQNALQPLWNKYHQEAAQ
jgi:hypothetical protein